MAYFLFIDESGQDKISHYEVLAGVAIEDRDIWDLVRDMQAAEERIFGMRYTTGNAELKGRKILKKKTFRLAAQLPPIPAPERAALAKECLLNGATANRRQITALAQAKLAYVSEVMDICSQHRGKVFASIVSRDAPSSSSDFLRKDYAYLFERYFYFLEDNPAGPSGVVVFDELDKSSSHILLAQMDRYFKETANGRARSGRIIPEPFFVHSDLTSGIQIADLVAYILSWGFRTAFMTAPKRDELGCYVEQVRQMRYRAVREINDDPNFVIWSIAVISDLRCRGELERS